MIGVHDTCDFIEELKKMKMKDQERQELEVSSFLDFNAPLASHGELGTNQTLEGQSSWQ